MRSLKSMIMGIAVLAMTISLSGLAFAEMGRGAYKCGKVDKEVCAAQIKTLRDSATALQTSNPTLAKGLSDLADKKAEEMKKWQEWSEKHDAKIKLLKDSSTALQASNPTLAQELQKMSEKKHMEKEEAGEKIEPKQ
jgi:peroxiredoxin